jgi:hypothetical protein
MIIKNSKIARVLNVNAIVFYPFIFISHDKKHFDNIKLGRYNILMNHEQIHYQQQKELLVIPFYIIYILNFGLNLFTFFFNGKLAYRNIIFEREAKTNELKSNYLITRKFWSFRKYIFSKTIR